MQIDLDFDCDDCKDKFTIGNGFLGAKEDFNTFISKNKKIDEESPSNYLECNPLMSMVSLCDKCIKKYK